MGNKIITTVCDVLLRDPATHIARYRGTTNSTTAYELTMSNTDVKGGRNNPLIYKYMHDRQLKVTIDTVTTDKQILASQLGTSVTNGLYNVLATDCITLDSSGVGTLKNTPIGNVDVKFADSNLLTNVTPSGSTITVSGGAGKKIEAMYIYSTTVDRVAVETTTPPSVLEMFMTGEVRDASTGNVDEYIQFYIPALQLDGAYKLDFKADGVSTESLSGTALSVTGADCTSGDTYGYVSWIKNTSSSYAYTAIAVTPNVYAPTHGVESTQQLTVYGLRGSALPPTNITSACTFAKNVAGATTISVGASTGEISVTSASVADETATITATFTSGGSTFTDTCVTTVV